MPKRFLLSLLFALCAWQAAAQDKVGGTFQVAASSEARAIHDDSTLLVARRGGGGFAVIWVAWSPASAGSVSNVYGQLYNVAGRKQGGAFLISTNVGLGVWEGEVDNVNVVSLSDGGFVVLWSWSVTEGYESPTRPTTVEGRSAQRFDTSGSPAGGVVDVAGQELTSAAPLIGGGFVEVWYDRVGFGADCRYKAQRYTNEISPIGAVIDVSAPVYSTGPLCNDYVEPAGLAGVGDGGFVVTWSADRFSSRGRRFSAAGELVGRAFVVSGAGRSTSVVGFPNGDFAVFFIAGPDQELYGQRYSPTQRIGGPFRMSDGRGKGVGGVSVTALRDDGFVASYWNDPTGAYRSPNLYGVRYTKAGKKAASFVIKGQVFQPGHAGLGRLKDGGYLAVWRGSASDQPPGIFAQRYAR